jgi:hypothetical protein
MRVFVFGEATVLNFDLTPNDGLRASVGMHSARTRQVKWGRTTIQDNALHGARGDERNGALTPIGAVEVTTTLSRPIGEHPKQPQRQPCNYDPKKPTVKSRPPLSAPAGAERGRGERVGESPPTPNPTKPQ